MKTRGIVLIAAGSPYYGQWALNLTMSIKFTCPDAKITLLQYGNGFNHVHYYSYLWDKVIQLPEETVTRNGIPNLLRPKVCLYDYTPYDETIFIDADVICFPTKKITDLFDQLSEVEFTIGCRSHITPANEVQGKEHWTPAKELLKTHAKNSEQEIYHLSSEFIYFKKTKATKKFFTEAKKYFDNPGVGYLRFANGVPDELAFQIAMLKTGLKPHSVPFLPFYWEPHEKKQLRYPELIKTGFYGLSMGGNANYEVPLSNYQFMSKFYAQQFGLKNHFPMLNKRQVIEHRTNI